MLELEDQKVANCLIHNFYERSSFFDLDRRMRICYASSNLLPNLTHLSCCVPLTPTATCNSQVFKALNTVRPPPPCVFIHLVQTFQIQKNLWHSVWPFISNTITKFRSDRLVRFFFVMVSSSLFHSWVTLLLSLFSLKSYSSFPLASNWWFLCSRQK